MLKLDNQKVFIHCDSGVKFPFKWFVHLSFWSVLLQLRKKKKKKKNPQNLVQVMFIYFSVVHMVLSM